MQKSFFSTFFCLFLIFLKAHAADMASELNRKIDDDQASLQSFSKVVFENTEFLKGIFKAEGWPKISNHGLEAARNAALICQHADHDRFFQEECLQRMKEALKTDDVFPGDVAYLIDRLATNADRPQIFGSQGSIGEKNCWNPRKIQNPKKVNELRLKYGLPSLEEYKKEMNKGRNGC